MALLPSTSGMSTRGRPYRPIVSTAAALRNNVPTLSWPALCSSRLDVERPSWSDALVRQYSQSPPSPTLTELEVLVLHLHHGLRRGEHGLCVSLGAGEELRIVELRGLDLRLVELGGFGASLFELL